MTAIFLFNCNIILIQFVFIISQYYVETLKRCTLVRFFDECVLHIYKSLIHSLSQLFYNHVINLLFLFLHCPCCRHKTHESHIHTFVRCLIRFKTAVLFFSLSVAFLYLLNKIFKSEIYKFNRVKRVCVSL